VPVLVPSSLLALSIILLLAFEVACRLRYSPQAPSIDTCKLDVAFTRVNLMGDQMACMSCTM
jgi:hypothetical protein